MFENITRRNLVKSAAVLGGAALVANGVALADEAPANRVCEALGIEKPVVQALMGGETSPELASAVSNAGGLGILELPGAEAIQATKALTDKPICAALYGYDDATAAMLKEEGVDIVLLANGGSASDNGYTIDATSITQFKEAGFKVLFKALNATVDNVLAAQDAGADVIAVIGFGAGGCGPKINASTSELIAQFVKYVDVPMLAAGGIVDAASASAAAVVGAEGAYVGTRFIASEECTCADVTKQAIVDANPQDFVLVPWQSGSDGYMDMSVSALSTQGLAMLSEGATAQEIFATTAIVYATMHSGEIEDNGICVGCGTGLIDSVKSAAEIVDDIASAF